MRKQNQRYTKSILFGAGLGTVFGGALGAATGSLTGDWNGIQFGIIAGIAIGIATGASTGAITTKVAGDTGGVSIGAYTGMAYGAAIGIILGFLVPDSFRAEVASLNILILQVITQGRFETAMLLGFLLSVLGTGIGAWVAGKNLKPREIAK